VTRHRAPHLYESRLRAAAGEVDAPEELHALFRGEEGRVVLSVACPECSKDANHCRCGVREMGEVFAHIGRGSERWIANWARARAFWVDKDFEE
jgi:hypothetical protein